VAQKEVAQEARLSGRTAVAGAVDVVVAVAGSSGLADCLDSL